MINNVSFVGFAVDEEEYNPEIVIDDYPLPPLPDNLPLQTPTPVQEISPPDNDVIVSPDNDVIVSPYDDEFDDYAPASPNVDIINELERTSVRSTR